MGGAFTSIRDDLAALDFNPANFTLENSIDEIRFNLFVNPIGPFLALANREHLENWTGAAATVFRGFGLALHRLHVGFLFGEESLVDSLRLSRKDPFNAKGFGKQSSTSFGFSLHLAPRVSIGAALEGLVHDGKWGKAKVGYRYGIHIRPRNNLAVGLYYFDFPDKYQEDRLVLERLEDATMNLGISYVPFGWILIAADVRNVSDEKGAIVREPHLGMEVTPFRHISVRTGYYRSQPDAKNVFSVGVGLLDQSMFFRRGGIVAPPRWMLHSTYVVEKGPVQTSRWLFITCLMKI